MSVAAAPPAPPAAPPQPLYILRAHTAPIHALHFTASNTHLLTGDSSGHVIVWTLATRRALSIFRAHTSALLAITTLTTPTAALPSPPYILTHARDHTLQLFSFPRGTPAAAAATTATPHNPPAHITTLPVNALNFCGAAVLERAAGALVAVPSPLETQGVDVLRLPDGGRVHANVQAGGQTGMAMALRLRGAGDARLELCVGYESGEVALLREGGGAWETVWVRREHRQPVLGLAVHGACVWSSAADARVVRYALEGGEVVVRETGHAGQQGVVVREDGEIVATAGWDGVVRVYRGVRGMRELAVLKWHRDGVYAVEFGRMVERGEGGGAEVAESPEGGEGGEVAHRSVEEERVWRETRRHWLAAGAKDGKVSLWEIY